MPKVKEDYQSLSTELDAIVFQLQQPDIQVDDAVKLYGRGLELIKALERHLQQAENTIQTLKLAAAKAEGKG